MPQPKNIYNNTLQIVLALSLLKTVGNIVLGVNIGKMIPDCNKSRGGIMLGVGSFVCLALEFVDLYLKSIAAKRASYGLPGGARIDPFFQVLYPSSSDTAIAATPPRKMHCNYLWITAISALQTVAAIVMGVGMSQSSENCDYDLVKARDMIFLATLANMILEYAKVCVKSDAAERASDALGVRINSFYVVPSTSPINPETTANTGTAITAITANTATATRDPADVYMQLGD
jgi:hypothetical protein